MASLTRDQVKAVVLASLAVIADLPTNPEQSTFGDFNDTQKQVFLNNLKTKLNALPYVTDDGSTSNAAYYDVNLKPNSTDDWPTVKDCIDWVTAHQFIVYT